MSHVSHCQVCDEGAYPEDNGCWCGLCHQRAMEAQRARLLNAPCQRCQLESVEAERDDLRAEVERRDALIRSDGYEDMRQHAAHLAQQLDAARAEVERLRVELEQAAHAMATDSGPSAPGH